MPARPIPPLRPLDCSRIRSNGRDLIRVRDGQGISPEVAVPLPLFALAQLFDGRKGVVEVQAEIARGSGSIIPGADIERVVGELDAIYLLDSPRYRARLQETLRSWESAPVREATHAGEGLCYADDPAALEAELDQIYRRPGAVGAAAAPSAAPLRGIIAPHIDFGRGGHCYTWAYAEIRGRRRSRLPECGNGSGLETGRVAPPLYVILGTSHQPMRAPFALTRKSYGTPWGPAPTELAIVEELEARGGPGLFEDEYNHRGEHSVEFQVVFLRHALAGEAFAVVPILCAGFHEAMERGGLPVDDPRVERFLAALHGVLSGAREAGREAILVAGVDLAHVGRHFGDAEPLSDRALAEVRRADQALLEKAASVDSAAFFRELARDGDRRRVCGAGPIYAFLNLLERDGAAAGAEPKGEGSKLGRVEGKVLAYDQAVDRQSDLCVSFASMAFQESGVR